MTGRKTVSRAELADLAAGLKRLLDAIEAGELSAGSGTRNRLQGAWLAIETLAAGRPLGGDELLREVIARDSQQCRINTGPIA